MCHSHETLHPRTFFLEHDAQCAEYGAQCAEQGAVLRIWFALLHLLRSASQTQVVPSADGPEIVVKTTKQASFCVTLLLPTLAREHTFQDMIGPHFCCWCIVVLWSGLHRSVRRRHFPEVLSVTDGSTDDVSQTPHPSSDRMGIGDSNPESVVRHPDGWVLYEIRTDGIGD